MNIFIMIFAVLIMGAYFMMGSPSVRIREHEPEYAINRSDMRGIAECAAAAHNAEIHDMVFDDICVAQNGIETGRICLNSRLAETNCEIVRNKKPDYSYIITTTAPIADQEYDSMIEILEQYYSDAGTFGVFRDGAIVAGGTATRRIVPKGIVASRDLQDGQLVYMTQFEMPDVQTEFDVPYDVDINCPAGTVKTYRFSRWQCVPYNAKTNCAGDTIWDSDIGECVADESRKPLCASQQTAVMVDDVWECVNPFPDRECPGNLIARLNYTTLEWECVEDPTITTTTKKCSGFTTGAIYGAIGATMRVPASSCTDCEQMITNTETCTAVCVPDPAKLNDPKCYPDGVRGCSGSNRAIYFGFPSVAYSANVNAVAERSIPMDAKHSRNRKFNCLDCGAGEIDTERSLPPYVAVCKDVDE